MKYILLIAIYFLSINIVFADSILAAIPNWSGTSVRALGASSMPSNPLSTLSSPISSPIGSSLVIIGGIGSDISTIASSMVPPIDAVIKNYKITQQSGNDPSNVLVPSFNNLNNASNSGRTIYRVIPKSIPNTLSSGSDNVSSTFNNISKISPSITTTISNVGNNIKNTLSYASTTDISPILVARVASPTIKYYSQRSNIFDKGIFYKIFNIIFPKGD